jgi:hypothetical protein
VEEGCYLKTTITADEKDDREVMKRINRGKVITRKLHSLLWSESLTEEFVKDDEKLFAMEMGNWRRCCRLTFEDRVQP